MQARKLTAAGYPAHLPDSDSDEDSIGQARPPRQGEHVTDDLPEELKDREDNKWLYPDGYQGLYGVLRRQNKPLDSEIQVDGGTNFVKLARVGITVRDETGQPFGHLGSSFPPEEGEADQRVVNLQYVLHSQVPAIKLLVARGEDSKAEVVIHANSLQRSKVEKSGEHVVGFEMRTSNDPRMKQDYCHPLMAIEKGAAGLMEIRFRLADNCKTAPPPCGPPYCQPIITGISEEEIAALFKIAQDKNCQFGDLSVLSPGNWLLIAITSKSDFSIYRSCSRTEESEATFERFKGYFQSAMVDCALNGNFPHYRRHAARLGVGDIAFDLDRIVPPQNMVEKWRVTYKDGVAVDAKAEKWAPFPDLTDYPDPETKALAERIAKHRSHKHARLAIREQLDTMPGGIDAAAAMYSSLSQANSAGPVAKKKRWRRPRGKREAAAGSVGESEGEETTG